MNNFVFQNCTKIIFGTDAQKRLGQEVRQYAEKVLLVHYGDDFIKKEILPMVLRELQEVGINVIELDGVQPNPYLKCVYKGIDICRKNDIGFIMALGGGSVIDTAKAIAAGVLYEGDVWDLFTKKAGFTEALPTGVFVTIPGTGSESSNGAVVTNEETEYKLDIIDDCLRPKFAIMNPEFTCTLPPYLTFCGAADIMSHVMERYFTTVKNTDLTDRLCEAVLRCIIRNARILKDNPDDYNSRAEIMWASTIAHNDLLSTGRVGDWASHMMGMELSAVYNCTHGATLTVVTPAWMEYVYKYELDKFTQFSVRVFDVEYDFDAPERSALLGIHKLKRFFKELDLPVSLRDLGINNREKIYEMSKKCVERGNIGKLKSLNEEDVKNIFSLAW